MKIKSNMNNQNVLFELNAIFKIRKLYRFCEVQYKRTEQSLKIFNNFFSKSLKLVL